MTLRRSLTMAGLTLLIAGATGHLMQQNQTARAYRIAANGGFAPDARPEQIVPVSASYASDRKPLAPRSEPAPLALSGHDCVPVLTLRPAKAAMVELSLSAPCYGAERVVIRHSGLAVTAHTDDQGAMTVELPALARDARFTVAFAGGISVGGTVEVPDLGEYDRMGVQWLAPDEFQMHAFEFGADYGEDGHVSASRPRNPAWAEAGAGGFLSILGDSTVASPLLAEVYTFPSTHSRRQGEVRVHIEAPVTADNCGREMLGETLRLRQGAPLEVVDLTVTMPGCDSKGEFLVLKNLVGNLKIARN